MIADPPVTEAPPPPRRLTWLYWVTAAVLVLGSFALRAWPYEQFREIGYDEVLYRVYAITLDRGHFLDLPEVYLQRQRAPGAQAELPPTRFLYVACGWLWKRVRFGEAAPANPAEPGWNQRDPYWRALRQVSAGASFLLVLAGAAAAWRMLGPGAGLAALALLGCSPLGLHMSQHAMIDGFFALWATVALWSLWENLRRPESPAWLAAYGASLLALVLTKENAFFVYAGLLALLVANRWTRFGEARRSLWAVTLLASAIGVALLVGLTGGVPELFETYRLLIRNASQLDYAMLTGDGPWHRYLVDLLLLSPLVCCLAMAAGFRAGGTHRAWVYLLGFWGFTYLLMCNVRFGMNLRYATIWELPMRLLAYGQLCWMTGSFPQAQRWLLPALVALLCLYDLRQDYLFFVSHSLYELLPRGLLRAVDILK